MDFFEKDPHFVNRVGRFRADLFRENYNAGNVYIPRDYVLGEGIHAKGLDLPKLAEHIDKMEGSSIKAWGFEPDRLLRPKICRSRIFVEGSARRKAKTRRNAACRV